MVLSELTAHKETSDDKWIQVGHSQLAMAVWSRPLSANVATTFWQIGVEAKDIDLTGLDHFAITFVHASGSEGSGGSGGSVRQSYRRKKTYVGWTHVSPGVYRKKH